MKFLRCILVVVSTLLALALFTRCDSVPGTGDPIDNPGPEDPDVDNSLNELSLYEAFKTQFDSGRSMAGFLVEGNGSYRVVFDDGRSREFNENEADVALCTTAAWPAVKPGGGMWHVDGKSTGIPYSDSRGGERIVVVIYDTEGLYVRLSSGYMFFFHTGAVRDIGCFRFEKALNPSLREDVVCTVTGNSISGRLDPATTVFDLVATVGLRGTELSLNGVYALRSSVTELNYSRTVSLTLKRNGAGNLLFDVALKSAGQIPILYISTGGRSIPENTYIDATMRLCNPDGLYSDQTDATFPMQIHGRGNSTWGMPKKPYKIKLAEKTRLLGMSDSKHWTLLANYSDKSLLRNALAFKLSELAGMAWAVRWRPVEVYLNDSYQGLYQLAEHIRVEPERVSLEVAGAADNSDDALTGGYFLWIDSRSREQAGSTGAYGFWTSRGLPVTVEEPEIPTTAQFSYIQNFIKQTELDIYNLTFEQYSGIIDLDSFIQYFFVTELGKNVDGDMRLSTYMWKPRGGKLGFPCVWDFDLAFGNCDYNNSGNGPTGWHIRNAIWFRQLFRNEKFCAKVTEAWREFYPKLTQAEAEMRAQAKLMDDAQKRNFVKWNILSTHVWPNYVVKGSYQGELDYMLDFFKTRAEWMNTEITAGRHKNN